MTEKRMLIVDDEVARKIDENRGDMSRSEFLSFLIDSQFKKEEPHTQSKKETAPQSRYVEREEFEHFTHGMKELLRNFLDFFVSYGLELGEQPKDQTFNELCEKLQLLSSKEKAK